MEEKALTTLRECSRAIEKLVKVLSDSFCNNTKY